MRREGDNPMPPVLERTSTITEKGQTTVPKPIRDALGVSYGGRIVFRVDEHGVSLRPAEEDGDDPILESFLNLLADDMRKRPGALSEIPAALAQRIQTLIEGGEVHLDEEIKG